MHVRTSSLKAVFFCKKQAMIIKISYHVIVIIDIDSQLDGKSETEQGKNKAFFNERSCDDP